jgi:hypothetical protein
MTSELRQRHQATTTNQQSTSDERPPRQRLQSETELPVLQANGQPATERTQIPSPSNVVTLTTMTMDPTMDSSSATATNQPTGNQTQSQVAKAEGKKRKIAIRVVSSVLMIGTFLGLMYMGHAYICWLIALVELLLVREKITWKFCRCYRQ